MQSSIITYNVQVSNKPKELTSDIRNIIETFNPDYLCLQEYSIVNEIEDFFKEKGYETIYVEYNRNNKYPQGLLTAFKNSNTLKKSWIYTIPENKIFVTEMKAIQVSLFETGRVDRIIINSHLPTFMKGSSKIDFLLRVLKYFRDSYQAEIYLCGDFNTITSNSVKEMISILAKEKFYELSNMQNTLSISSDRNKTTNDITKKLLFKADYVFANFEDLEKYTISTEVLINYNASNHVPIIVNLKRK